MGQRRGDRVRCGGMGREKGEVDESVWVRRGERSAKLSPGHIVL